jgi:general secretion pathway protein F
VKAMPKFAYKALAPSGSVREGTVEAASRAAAIEWLRGQGQMPIRADPVGEGSFGRWRLGRGRSSDALSGRDLVLLTRELATLLQAGLPLDRVLAVMTELGSAGPRRRFVARTLEGLRGGATLADAMASANAKLPPFYIGMVRAGEAGGALDLVLARLADALERSQALRESVRSALYYPMIVLAVACFTLVVLLTAVLPEFRPLFDDTGAAMPASMAVLLWLGDALKRWWWFLVMLCLAIALGIRIHNGQPQGRLRWDRWLSRIPLLGDLLLKVEVARFARSLGTLLGNGVATLQAFSIAAGTIGNRALAQAIGGVEPRLRRGDGLARPLLDSGAFPRLAAQLVQVGEESGQLETMLLRVADLYDEEVKRTLQRLMALLVPAVTIGLGLLVAGIIAAMLSAILGSYDLAF